MIIPVKCVTCGNVLADKYLWYQRECRKRKLEKGLSINKTVYLTTNNVDKTVEGHVLDDLKLFDPCCRRHMLTHVDI